MFNAALQALLEERERWVLWLQVGFGVGIALYFALPFEPSLWTIPLLLLPALAMTMFIQRKAVPQDGFSIPVLSLIIMLIGFGAAQWRTHLVDAPAIEQRGAYQLEGEVLLVEARGKGDRLVLADLAIEDLPADAKPARVRFSRRIAEPPLAPGDRIRVRAMLMQPSPPSEP